MVTNSDQSEKRKRWLFGSLLTVVILALLCLLSYSNWQMFQRRREIKTELKQLNRKVEALQREKEAIQASLNQGNDQIVEEIAREQLNLKKPGEKVIDIKKPEQLEQQQRQKEWWREWLDQSSSFVEKTWKKVQFW